MTHEIMNMTSTALAFVEAINHFPLRYRTAYMDEHPAPDSVPLREAETLLGHVEHTRMLLDQHAAFIAARIKEYSK